MDECLVQKEVLDEFFKPGQVKSVESHDGGHINDTLVVTADTGRFILQRINTNVFLSPDDVMENICNVTSHLKRVILSNGGDPDRETLTPVFSRAGKSHVISDSGAYRMYTFIPDSICIENNAGTFELYEAGRIIGKFFEYLKDFDASTLYETIPDFHNTPKRFDNFVKSLNADVYGRANMCRREIDFILSRYEDTKVLTNVVKSGDLKISVTHNDTKLSNILFDANTKKGLCLIDYDTIMPGLAVNDFGDAVRSGACVGKEDEKSVDDVAFSLERYKAIADGYRSSAVLTGIDKEMLPWGARLMTLECGIRFLTDYLDGDIYFKTNSPEHNLRRARTQFKLVSDMEKYWDEILTC